jgi:hypothetical protein
MIIHHLVVGICAEKVIPGPVFKRYALLLGDDIVIGDERVAEHYRSFMQEIEVQISLAKSLVSRSGCLEFAKRFLIHRASN